MSQITQCKLALALQFVRGNLINISDKYEVRFVDFKAMQLNPNRQPGDPIPSIKLRVKQGTPELRRETYTFTAKANDIQRGRSDRFPNVLVRDNDNWWALKIFSVTPAVGVLRHPTGSSLLWIFGNSSGEKQHLRLLPVTGKSIHDSMLHNEISRSVDDDGKVLVEVVLEPYDLAVVEWK